MTPWHGRVPAGHEGQVGYETTRRTGDPRPPRPFGRLVNDSEGRYLMMTRVSNLLTTRSDTYTVYVEVQGWRGVGSTTPELVVQRRRAFIADRNALT